MAVYRQLLTSDGGGIMNDLQKGDRKTVGNLCIGLGGTGADTMKQLKREVYRCLKPDASDSPVPEYWNIRYLVIDRDSHMLGDPEDFRNINCRSEYFDISRDHESPDDSENEGAMLRQTARSLLLDKAPELKERLISIIREMLMGTSYGLAVHIFSGLSGATGGGILTDVCYILQSALDSLQMSACIYGYFFMPDVNISKAGIRDNPLHAAVLKKNGYAALKELDYLMELKERHGCFKQDYSDFSVETDASPVYLCYLISSVDQDGVPAEDGYRYGVNLAVNYMLLFLSKTESERHHDEYCKQFNQYNTGSTPGEMPYGYAPNQIYANELIERPHGASFAYYVIGLTAVEVPLSDITNYLAAKLFEGFGNRFGRIPEEKDLEEFAVRTQLTFEQLLQDLTQGISYTMPVLRSRFDSGHVIEILEANRRRLANPLTGYQISENPDSLISRIFSSLCLDYAGHAEKGPLFAQKLLGGADNKNLLQVLEEYIAENERRLQEELRRDTEAYAEKYTKEYTEGCAEMSSDESDDRYVHFVMTASYRAMARLLQELKEQVKQLHAGFFRIFSDTLISLQDTFAENQRYLSAENAGGNCNNSHILEVRDIQDKLDQAVTALDADQAYEHFIREMLQHCSQWLTQDEIKIARLVSDLMADLLGSMSKWNIADILQMKYDAENPYHLAERIGSDIMDGRLKKRENPRFWSDFQFNWLRVIHTILMPYNVREIELAADMTEGKSGSDIQRIGLFDRISQLHFRAAVPLYAYGGLADLEKAYESDACSSGLHLYETEDRDWRKFLPSPIPASLHIPGRSLPELEERNRRLTQELKEACEAGIVGADGIGGWEVKITPDLDREMMEKDYYTDGKADVLKLLDKISGLEECLDHMYDDGRLTDQVPFSICGARQETAQIIFQDNYIRFPDIQVLVQKELSKYRTYHRVLDGLKEELEVITREERIKSEFFRTVFTGVIEERGEKIICSCKKSGMEKILELSSSDMPYFTCALYQAYLTFAELEKEVHSQIYDRVVYIIDHYEDEDYEIAKRLNEKYNRACLKSVLSCAYLYSDWEKIWEFYQEFVKELREHLITYL